MSLIRNKICNAGGFTLLEILVVIVIAGLAVALVPPLFSAAVPGAKIRGAAHDFMVALRQTRSRAIIQNSEQQVVLDLENHRYRVGKDSVVVFPEEMRMQVQLVTGTKIDQTEQHIVSFFADGSSSGEAITLSGGQQAYRLQLDWLTGNITLHAGADHAG